MGDRDYVFERYVKASDSALIVICKGLDDCHERVRKSRVRVKNYHSSMVLGLDERGTVRFAIRHVESPGGGSSLSSLMSSLASRVDSFVRSIYRGTALVE